MHRFDTFGETGLKSLPRAASVNAQTNGSLYSIDGAVLREFIPENVLEQLLKKQLEHRPFFGSHKLFKSLPLKTKQLIANKSVKKDFKPGEAILEMGVNNDMFAILAEGEAEVLIPDVKTGNGKMTKVAQIGAHDFIGEMSLLNNEKTKARIISTTNTTVFMLPEDVFYELMQLSPQFSYMITNTKDKRSKENDEALNIFTPEDDD
jgi:CRP-like cAMP-binding protein